ncbi:MAG: glycosyltransferase family 39 protein, partial [Bacteroidia bacterium]|nr:glycosyltransferase family 39 protein [Bacteroidia bacterium]
LQFSNALKYTGLLIFGYLLLLSFSYPYEHPGYQAIFTLLTGICISLCLNLIHSLCNRHGATLIFWGIVFVGAMIRFSWAIFAPTQPISDFQYYYENATQLAQGTTVLTKNIGYTLLLSICLRIHQSILTGKLINATASTLSILFLYHVGSRLVNKQTGLFASFLFAILPSEILMVSVLGTEVVSTTLGLIVGLFIIRTWGRKNSSPTISIFWAGLFYGLALTVRSSFVFYFPAIVMWIVFTSFSNYSQMSKSFLTFIASLAIGLSITLMGYYASTKEFSIELLRTQDSYPFLSGTNLTTSGMYSVEDARLYFSWAADERDALARQEAINRIKSNPLGFLLLILRKIAILFGESYYGVYWSLMDIDWNIGKVLLALLSQSIYVTILFFAFLAFKDSKSNTLLLMINLILILSTVVPHTILEVQGRYHHYIMPFIVLLASNGIQQK